MKNATTCFVCLAITLILILIVLFFRDRFLFMVFGYDLDLLGQSSTEAFSAYRAVHVGRLLLVGLTLAGGVVYLVLCKNMERQSDNFFYTLGKLFSILTIILMGIILLLNVIIPKRIV